MNIYDKIKKGQEENIAIMKSAVGETIEDFIEKAKKAAVGEVHVWNGIKMRKTHNGWEPVNTGEGKTGGEKSDYKKGDKVLIASYNDETGRYDNWDDAHMGHVIDVSKLSEGKIKVQYSDMGGEPEPPIERDVKTIKSNGKTGGSGGNESAVTDLVMNQPKSKSGKDFFDVVVDYTGEPEDDGESESALVGRLMKMGDKKLGKFIDEFKKGGDIKKSISAIEIINQNDIIEKSHIIHDFSYSDEFKFSKKGKELKQKFAEAILDEVKEIKKYMVELQTLMVEIGELPIVPAGERQYYKVDGYEGKLAEMPNFYNIGDDELSKKKMRYNEVVNKVIDCSIEMVLLNTFIRNLDDNKEYKLNATQASKLGF